MRNSKIILCKNIKIDKDYKNILDYTEQEMIELCNNNIVVSADNYSFIRANGTIQTKFTYSDCLKSNYIAFQNKDYDNKWFFAWIDDVIFKGDNNTEIKYTIDSWSTFHNDLNLMQTLVVREHVSDDTVGLHTINENLDLGEYKVISHLRDAYNREYADEETYSNYCVVVASTIDLNNENEVFSAIYNGIPTGVRYFKFDINYSDPEFSPLDELAQVLYRLASNPLGNKLDAILGMFIVPQWLAKDLPNETIHPNREYMSITPLKDLDGYKPKNNKMLTYPYVYHLLSNCQGQDAILKQELWEKLENDDVIDNNLTLQAGDMVLQICGAITQGCSIRAIPENYNGDEIATNVGINLGKFPQVCWNSDAFLSWLTENGVNVATTGIGLALGLSTGNPILTSTSATQGIDLLKSGIKASEIPPQSHGNTNNGDIMMAMDENCFHIFKMSIKKDYAKRIDDYFTKYGYRVNALKIPNINNRKIFNYVQIAQDENIGYGNIPNNYMEIINKIFRNGVTIWHNHENIGNYRLDNSVK